MGKSCDSSDRDRAGPKVGVATQHKGRGMMEQFSFNTADRARRRVDIGLPSAGRPAGVLEGEKKNCSSARQQGNMSPRPKGNRSRGCK